MNKNALSVIGLLVLLAAGAWYISGYVSQKPLTTEEDAEVRAFVMEFGAKLQMVSVLAPEAELKAALESYYGPYVSPSLLRDLASAGPDAIGRQTSSPYPERIEIAEVRKTAPRSYVVEGTVVEIAGTASSTEVVGTYSVTLTLERREGKLLIIKIKKGPYSEIPHRQTVLGTWECLPHKDTSGPQTTECALGIFSKEDNKHYALNLSLMSRAPVDYRTGTTLRVSGILVPIEQLSTEQWQKYDIAGIISATTIDEVE
jgi:hypothetical protein